MKRGSMMIITILFLGLILWAGTAVAMTYYVDGTRPDNFGDGTSWATAKKTISAGIALLSPGDTLKIKSGSYSEAIDIEISGTSGAWITIETDDGNGNAGSVILTGSVTSWNDWGKWVIHVDDNTDYVKVDGRQKDGFTLKLSSSTHEGGIHAVDSGSVAGPVVFKYITIDGTSRSTALGGDSSMIFIGQHDNAEVAYCRGSVTSGNGFGFQIQDSDGASIHHSEVQGKCSGQSYAPIRMTRNTNSFIYNNYVHNIIYAVNPPYYISNRESTNTKIYNNVLWIEPGDSGNAAVELRGMQGSIGGSSNCEVYNNTLIVDGSLGYGFIGISNDTHDAKIYNNFVIGNVQDFVWTMEPGYLSSNELYHNVVTGAVSSWFETLELESKFDVVKNNLSGQGTAFINLSGNKPFPHWGLSESKDGTGTIPDTDYIDNPRADPPDVGAFEYGGGDSNPPDPPVGVMILNP